MIWIIYQPKMIITNHLVAVLISMNAILIWNFYIFVATMLLVLTPMVPIYANVMLVSIQDRFLLSDWSILRRCTIIVKLAEKILKTNLSTEANSIP